MKKTLILLLALSLLLCGCGKEPAPETAAPTDAPEATEATEIPEDQEAVTELPAEIPTITVTRQVRMAALNEDGEERWYREYTYDELGRLATEREVISTGEENSFATVTYADTEAGLEIRYAYNDGHIATTRESRDEQGNLVLREFLQDDQMEYATIYTYDEFEGIYLSEYYDPEYDRFIIPAADIAEPVSTVAVLTDYEVRQSGDISMKVDVYSAILVDPLTSQYRFVLDQTVGYLFKNTEDGYRLHAAVAYFKSTGVRL